MLWVWIIVEVYIAFVHSSVWWLWNVYTWITLETRHPGAWCRIGKCKHLYFSRRLLQTQALSLCRARVGGPTCLWSSGDFKWKREWETGSWRLCLSAFFPRQIWKLIIQEYTGLSFSKFQRMVQNREVEKIKIGGNNSQASLAASQDWRLWWWLTGQIFETFCRHFHLCTRQEVTWLPFPVQK